MRNWINIVEETTKRDDEPNAKSFVDALSEVIAVKPIPGGIEATYLGYRFAFGDPLSGDATIQLIKFESVGNHGQATVAMQSVLAVADQTRATIELFARPDDNTRDMRSRLVSWYERQGFVAVRGDKRRAAYIRSGADSLHMIRDPR